MAVIRTNALSRDRLLFAKMLRKISQLWAKRASQKPITPHLARDIGLSAAELERMTHRWPSEHTHHPML